MTPPDVGISTPDDASRNDDGSQDDSPGFDIQARIFAAIGVFLTLVSIGYGLLTSEWAGTTMLALTSGLVFTIGAYVGWQKPARGTSVDEAQGPHEDDQPWFPAASGWPFALAVAIVLVANGLLLGVWLFLPAAAFLAFALAGFIRQSRFRA